MLAILAATAVIVWAFAIIGAITVASAVTAGAPAPRPVPLIAAVYGDVDGWDIPGLARIPDSIRSDHRVSVWDAVETVEVEYLSSRSVDEALNHYRRQLIGGPWGMDDLTFTRGEWVFGIASGARTGTIEIERVDGRTEVEIEIVGPQADRGGNSDR